MKQLKDNRGNATVLAVALCLSLVLILCAIFEYMQMLIITSGIRNAVQSAVVSAVTANYNEAYSQLREGYSGGYLYSDTGFIESIDAGDIYGRLDALLGLKPEKEQHVKYTSSGQREYAVSDLQLTFENTSLAQNHADKNLNASVRICVTIPVRYGGRELMPLRLNMQIRASYMPKFSL